jgi:endonuclease/exonuclease/phosphatase family metal-dependent hydrolase
MKIAAYNVENLFDRAKAFNEKTALAQKIIKAAANLNALFEKANYSTADKSKMLLLMKELGLSKSDNGTFAILRKIRGRLIKRPRNKPMEIVATGRDKWVGWIELKTAPVNEIAIMNTGRVLRDVKADIVAVIEAEDRIGLKNFSDFILKKVGGTPYPHVMLLDGNDERGIDVGVMTKEGFSIEAIKPHIFDLNSKGRRIFSRDCPEYKIITPTNEEIWILPNHFKSKFGGDNASSRKRRKDQAEKTAQIYKRLVNEGNLNVIVLGDLNDTPDSDPLKPLLRKTDLKDVSEHRTFNPGKFQGIGTFELGNDSQKIDYLLLSPSLFGRVTSCGLFRKGAWPGVRPAPRWTVYPELKKKIHVASDHHVIWCEIE